MKSTDTAPHTEMQRAMATLRRFESDPAMASVAQGSGTAIIHALEELFGLLAEEGDDSGKLPYGLRSVDDIAYIRQVVGLMMNDAVQTYVDAAVSYAASN